MNLFPVRTTENMRILLVEDDPGVAASLKDGLVAAGFDVDHVANGKDAVTRMEQSLPGGADVPGAIVLDLGLPDIDGQDVCRRIRAGSDVPILVVSARGEEVDRVLALEFGAD